MKERRWEDEEESIIRKIQLAPQKVVAKLEEISPETIISDAIFPPKLKANDYSLFAGYFLQQVLDVYISRIQSTWLLMDDDIQWIIEILEFYHYQTIQSYILELPDSQAGNNLSMKNSQLLKKITLDDRVKTISEVVCT